MYVNQEINNGILNKCAYMYIEIKEQTRCTRISTKKIFLIRKWYKIVLIHKSKEIWQQDAFELIHHQGLILSYSTYIHLFLHMYIYSRYKYRISKGFKFGFSLLLFLSLLCSVLPKYIFLFNFCGKQNNNFWQYFQ